MRSLILICTLLSYTASAQNTNKGTIKVKKAATDIYTIVDVMPAFPGDNNSLYSFLQSNLTYPKSAVEAGIGGTCYVTFVVEADGRITNVKILRGVSGSPECDAEALRVIMLMPPWNPGTNKGQTVRVQYNLPIKFKLS